MDELHISKLFAAAFAQLDDLRAKSPAAASAISESIASHLRSSAPLSLLAPTASESVPSVERDLKDGARYRISTEGGCVVIWLRDLDSDETIATLAPIEVVRLRHDLDAVAGSVTR